MNETERQRESYPLKEALRSESRAVSISRRLNKKKDLTIHEAL